METMARGGALRYGHGVGRSCGGSLFAADRGTHGPISGKTLAGHPWAAKDGDVSRGRHHGHAGMRGLDCGQDAERALRLSTDRLWRLGHLLLPASENSDRLAANIVGLGHFVSDSAAVVGTSCDADVRGRIDGLVRHAMHERGTAIVAEPAFTSSLHLRHGAAALGFYVRCGQVALPRREFCYDPGLAAEVVSVGFVFDRSGAGRGTDLRSDVATDGPQRLNQ